jgi:hypothetical protein
MSEMKGMEGKERVEWSGVDGRMDGWMGGGGWVGLGWAGLVCK